jgi:hypothetical protein
VIDAKIYVIGDGERIGKPTVDRNLIIDEMYDRQMQSFQDLNRIYFINTGIYCMNTFFETVHLDDPLNPFCRF